LSKERITDASSSSIRVRGAEEAYTAPENLGPAIASGVKWKLVSQVLREGTRLGVGILLARLLTPEEWGIAGMALVVAAFLAILPYMGLNHALVSRTTISEEDRSTVFWMSLALGVAMTLLGIALASVVARFFGEPQVEELFWLASVGFTITSLSTVPGALMTRDLAYRSLELRQMAGTLVGSAVAVGLALAGAGPWAIVANSIASATASTFFLWLLSSWRPRFLFSRESYRDLGGFGIRVYGAQILQYFQLNADNLLIGRYLGPAALGSYAFAYNLMVTPLLNVAWPIQHVVFPALASIQDDQERLRAVWLRGKRLALAIMAPGFLALAVVGPDLVPLVFGPKWNDSIPVLQLLCLAGLAYSIGTQNQILLMVRNRARTLFWLSLAIVGITVAGIVVGLFWGIVGVSAALAITQWALVAPETWVTTRAGRMRFWETLFVTCSPLPFAFAAAGVGYVVRLEAKAVGVPSGVRIVLAVLTMIVVYLGSTWLGSSPLREEMREALSHVRRRLGLRTDPRPEVPLNTEA